MNANTSSASVASSSETMLRMVVGPWVSQAIYVAAKLGIADLLHGRAQTYVALAQTTRTHADALYRVLRALASLGIFEEKEGGVFALTSLADCLRTETSGSLRAFAIMLGEKEHWQAWGEVLHSVKTGKPAFDHVFDVPHFEYFARHPDAARIFDEGMTSRSGAENDAITLAYDFSQFSSVVDVGGGQGTLLAAILRAAPATKGVLFDLPHVIASHPAAVAQTLEANRFQSAAGSFFEIITPGGDAYILKKVIHDWDDDRALSILKNCCAAMSPTARLLLIEPIIPAGNTPSFNKFLDLMMLIWTSGGRERTEVEHKTLLTKAGLEPLQVIPTDGPLTIIEAKRHNNLPV